MIGIAIGRTAVGRRQAGHVLRIKNVGGIRALQILISGVLMPETHCN
jgi:hypothetical protein